MTDNHFSIIFEESWFPKKDSVEDLLNRLDMGESIPLSKFKEACKKEGKTFSIEIE